MIHETRGSGMIIEENTQRKIYMSHKDLLFERLNGLASKTIYLQQKQEVRSSLYAT